jgi:hypothetical protein
MNRTDRAGKVRKGLVLISVATVVSGGAQMVAPGFVLKQLDASGSDTDRHLFATIGMFMAVVGGLLFQDLVRREDDPTVLLWAGLQKLGAAGAVVVGVNRRVFASRALAVAGFDAVSGVGCLAYRRRTVRRLASSASK